MIAGALTARSTKELVDEANVEVDAALVDAALESKNCNAKLCARRAQD